MNRRINLLYEDITNKIISKLEQNIIPWRRSWRQGLPRNYITGKVYQGINYLNLCFDDFPNEFYLTYLQARAKNGYVNKGAKGKSILFWKINEIERNDNLIKVPLLRLSNVFNLSQTSLFDKSNFIPTINISCEEVINNMPFKPEIRNNFQRCCYNIQEDFISTPSILDFDSEAEYYSSVFHELAHSTGHPNRLGRISNGDMDYAEEELVAELCSSYLCAHSGISQGVLDNQSSYIGGWLKKLGEDKMFIVRVAQKAKHAADFILGKNET